jgi:hypothetical protein
MPQLRRHSPRNRDNEAQQHQTAGLAMSMKKTDLEKNKAKKIAGTIKTAVIPDRFAQGAAASSEKRERRARDAAAGLVPFACKLPAELLKTLHERAAAHEGGVNALVAELLAQGLARP